MYIIGVSGAWTERCPVWGPIFAACLRVYPDAKVVLAEIPYCQPWEIARMHALIDDIVAKFGRREECLLMGHSLGGILACASALRFSSRIVGIVTICSPHTYFGQVYPLITLLGADKWAQTPILSYGARRDEVLWWGMGTRHPHALRHVVLDTNHLSDFVDDPAHANRIVHDTKRLFAP